MDKWTNKNYSEETFKEAWLSSNNLNEVAEKLGYTCLGANRHTLRRYAEYLNLPPLKGNKRESKKSVYTEEDLINGTSGLNNKAIKGKLLSIGLLRNECYSCGLKDEWCNLPLSLHLDHIDGNNKNNKLNNLRILCPNCHNQTDTFCGNKVNSMKKFCVDCGIKISSLNVERCSDCHYDYTRPDPVDYVDWETLGITKELFILTWNYSHNVTDVIIKLNLSSNKSRQLRAIARFLNLSESHFKSAMELKYPLKDILVNGKHYGSSKLRVRLIKEEIFEEKCYACNNVTWLIAKIPLHLEHINGDHNDNRLENLTLLCANCHSQTKTYSRRKITNCEQCNCIKNDAKKYCDDCKKTCQVSKTDFNNNIKIRINNCVDCGDSINRDATRCQKCDHKKQEKINWPSDDELVRMVTDSNFVSVAKNLGVSDNAIRKRLRLRGRRIIRKKAVSR